MSFRLLLLLLLLLLMMMMPLQLRTMVKATESKMTVVYSLTKSLKKERLTVCVLHTEIIPPPKLVVKLMVTQRCSQHQRSAIVYLQKVVAVRERLRSVIVKMQVFQLNNNWKKTNSTENQNSNRTEESMIENKYW